MFEFRHQPLKAVYLIFFVISTLFVRLPYWIVMAINPAWRARKTWSMRRAIIVSGLRAYVETFFDTELPYNTGQIPEPEDVLEDSEDSGFTWVDPISDKLVVGDVRDLAWKNKVKITRTFGYWFKTETMTGKRNQPAGPHETIIFYLHAGGYIMGSAHPRGGGGARVCESLLQHCPKVSRIFSGRYRLSSSAPFPEKNPFPAALLDALASYYYLLHVVGVRAQNIILCGSSAGGHLAISLLRYLTINKKELKALPVPGALLLLSGTVDLGNSHDGPNSTLRLNMSTDYCGPFLRGYSSRSLLGKLPANAVDTNPWISPASLKLPEVYGLFKGFPKTYILVGDGEVALDSTCTFHNRLVADIGYDKITYNEVKDATHDFIAWSWHEPERSAALRDICAWLEAL